jgi:hypothetical protein
MESSGDGPAQGRHTNMQAALEALGRHGVALTRRRVELIAKSENPTLGGNAGLASAAQVPRAHQVPLSNTGSCEVKAGRVVI